MSYKAVIAVIKDVRAFPKADNIKLASVNNVQIVVGSNTKEGDIGVFFSDDGCLSEKMGTENNLYADRTRNKRDEKGYFDNNLRVRAQKFRGEKSYGLWLSLSSLEILQLGALVSCFILNR
jgi:tRNA-binding EMAP/Myf-like protein